jgi:hypothetical protein
VADMLQSLPTIKYLDVKMLNGGNDRGAVLHRTWCLGADLRGVPGPDRCGAPVG